MAHLSLSGRHRQRTAAELLSPMPLSPLGDDLQLGDLSVESLELSAETLPAMSALVDAAASPLLVDDMEDEIATGVNRFAWLIVSTAHAAVSGSRNPSAVLDAASTHLRIAAKATARVVGTDARLGAVTKASFLEALEGLGVAKETERHTIAQAYDVSDDAPASSDARTRPRPMVDAAAFLDAMRWGAAGMPASMPVVAPAVPAASSAAPAPAPTTTAAVPVTAPAAVAPQPQPEVARVAFNSDAAISSAAAPSVVSIEFTGDVATPQAAVVKTKEESSPAVRRAQQQQRSKRSTLVAEASTEAAAAPSFPHAMEALSNAKGAYQPPAAEEMTAAADAGVAAARPPSRRALKAQTTPARRVRDGPLAPAWGSIDMSSAPPRSASPDLSRAQRRSAYRDDEDAADAVEAQLEAEVSRSTAPNAQQPQKKQQQQQQKQKQKQKQKEKKKRKEKSKPSERSAAGDAGAGAAAAIADVRGSVERARRGMPSDVSVASKNQPSASASAAAADAAKLKPKPKSKLKLTAAKKVTIAAGALASVVPLKQGDACEANFEGGGTWYGGTVGNARDNGNYDIVYDDGDDEKNVAPHFVRGSKAGGVLTSGSMSAAARVRGHGLAETKTDPSATSTRDLDSLDRDELIAEAAQRRRENEALKKELASFDLQFFEDLEDLKFKYSQLLQRNSLLEKKHAQSLGLPYKKPESGLTLGSSKNFGRSSIGPTVPMMPASLVGAGAGAGGIFSLLKSRFSAYGGGILGDIRDALELKDDMHDDRVAYEDFVIAIRGPLHIGKSEAETVARTVDTDSDGLDYRTFLQALAPFATNSAFPLSASTQKSIAGAVAPSHTLGSGDCAAVKELRRIVAPATSVGQRRRNGLVSELKRAIKTYAVGASTSIPVENFREAVELSGLGLPARVIMDVCDAFSHHDADLMEDVVDVDQACRSLGIRNLETTGLDFDRHAEMSLVAHRPLRRAGPAVPAEENEVTQLVVRLIGARSKPDMMRVFEASDDGYPNCCGSLNRRDFLSSLRAMGIGKENLSSVQIETFLDEMCERFPGTLRTAATATADVGRRRGGGKAVVDVGDPPSIDYHRFVDWSCDERRQVLMRRVQRHVFKMPAAAQQKLVKNVRRAFERADPSGDGTLGKIQFGRLMSSVGAMLGFSGTDNECVAVSLDPKQNGLVQYPTIVGWLSNGRRAERSSAFDEHERTARLRESRGGGSMRRTTNDRLGASRRRRDGGNGGAGRGGSSRGGSSLNRVKKITRNVMRLVGDNSDGDILMRDLKSDLRDTEYCGFLRWISRSDAWSHFERDRGAALDLDELHDAISEWADASDGYDSSEESRGRSTVRRRGGDDRGDARSSSRGGSRGGGRGGSRGGSRGDSKASEISRKMLHFVDDDGDGKLSMRELKRNLRDTEYSGFLKWLTMSDAWSHFDRDGSGSLDIHELREAITDWVDAKDGYDGGVRKSRGDASVRRSRDTGRGTRRRERPAGDGRSSSRGRNGGRSGGRGGGRGGSRGDSKMSDISRKMLHFVDDDGDGKLSMKELKRNLRDTEYSGFLKWLSKSDAWSHFDRDGSGSLDIYELREAIADWVDAKDGYDGGVRKSRGDASVRRSRDTGRDARDGYDGGVRKSRGDASVRRSRDTGRGTRRRERPVGDERGAAGRGGRGGRSTSRGRGTRGGAKDQQLKASEISRKMLHFYDDDGDGKLSMRELKRNLRDTNYSGFLKWISKSDAWSHFDRDGSGSLDIYELREAIADWVDAKDGYNGGRGGVRSSNGDASMRRAGGGDGGTASTTRLATKRRAQTLTSRSVRGGSGSGSSDPVALKKRVQEITRKMIHTLDDNDDGKLSIRELTRNLRKSAEYGGFLDFITKNNTMAHYDKDQSGSLDISELRGAIKEWIESSGEDGYDAQHAGGGGGGAAAPAARKTRQEGEGRGGKRGGADLGVRGRSARTHRAGRRDER